MSASNADPAWVASPPALFDIVATYFPEHTDPEKPGLKLRPGLVVKVWRGKATGLPYCDIAYGTKRLKIAQRQRIDMIIQNAHDLAELGLFRATRFDLDLIARRLPWTKEYFGCWTGYQSPAIGALTEKYIKEYAYLMMARGLAP
jgi:hypothetical protein